MEAESCCSRCALAGRRDHDHEACTRRHAELRERAAGGHSAEPVEAVQPAWQNVVLREQSAGFQIPVAG